MKASRRMGKAANTPATLTVEEKSALLALITHAKETCINGELRINDRLAEKTINGLWTELCEKLERLSIIDHKEYGTMGNIYRVYPERAVRLLS